MELFIVDFIYICILPTLLKFGQTNYHNNLK